MGMLRRADVRLVSLTGPGGTGKTRLALQIGVEMLDELADGVISVELAPLNDPSLVPSTIGRTLGVAESAGKPILEVVKEYLHDKRLLLVLDNFEQVAEAAPTVDALMRSATHLKILVTSRVGLNLYGEHTFPVPPLSLPDMKHLPPVERMTSQYEAVRLFIERAQAVKPDFVVTNDNAHAVAEICVRLDGLPLAIELAAARTRLFSPQALLSRLSSRLKMLTGGASNLPKRQQTLRGTIEWSYDLLPEGEKQLFWRMAVFQGGGTLEALEEVCNHDGSLQIDVVDCVGSIMQKSLLEQREGRDGEPRLWMLETIHEYAREKLKESGEAEPLQREHALYFMRLGEAIEPHLTGKKQREWLDRLEDEYDNVRIALAWAEEQAEAEGGNKEGADTGLRTAGAIWRFWMVRGLFTEGREHLERLERAISTPEAAGQGRSSSTLRGRAKALNGAGYLAWRQGDYSSARPLLEAALVLGSEAGDKQSMSLALNALGNVAHDQGDYTAARALYEESLALRRELGDKWGIAASLNNLGLIAKEQGDYTAARALHEESLPLFKEIGDEGGMAQSLHNFGSVAKEQGDYTAARALYEESLALCRELGDKWGIAACLNSLGLIAKEQGDYTAARALHEESLSLFKEIRAKGAITASLNALGNVAKEQGDYSGARALYKESLALRWELGDKWGIAACLVGLGGVAVGVGQVERGAKLLGAVEGLLQSIGAVLDRSDRLPYERSLQQARSQLSEEEFDKAWQEGHAMSMEQAIQYALEVS